jgi:acyl phosphate:glycerol-3-phosphate acyltransferase
MPLLFYAGAAAGAYLLGSIPFGFLLVLFFRREDIRQTGSGNIGATNVIRSGAKGLGAVTFLLDVLKGYAAVLLCGMAAARVGLAPHAHMNAVAVAGLCAILGHVYTMWLRFKGGKGVATAFGVFLGLAPWAALAALGVFAVVFALTRYVSLGSVLSAVTFPLFALLIPHAPRTVTATVVLFVAPVIVILKHRANIARLMSGREYRFGRSGERSGSAS